MDASKKLFGHGDNAEAIKKVIEDSFSDVPVVGLVVKVNDDTVTLTGVMKDIATREKTILIAGNVEGVAHVVADELVSPEIIDKTNERDVPEPVFYTIKDADKIYPGQAIRIPAPV